MGGVSYLTSVQGANSTPSSSLAGISLFFPYLFPDWRCCFFSTRTRVGPINYSYTVSFSLLFSAETSQGSSPDTVQCGGCRASYPLGDIVRFIEHKVNHCRSTLQGCHSPPPAAAPEDSDPEDALALKAEQEKLNSVPSISAPINKRGSRLESPPTPQGSGSDGGSPIELRASASSTPKRRLEEDKEELPKKPKTESVDADTNTTSSGKQILHPFFFLPQLLSLSY